MPRVRLSDSKLARRLAPRSALISLPLSDDQRVPSLLSLISLPLSDDQRVPSTLGAAGAHSAAARPHPRQGPAALPAAKPLRGRAHHGGGGDASEEARGAEEPRLRLADRGPRSVHWALRERTPCSMRLWRGDDGAGRACLASLASLTSAPGCGAPAARGCSDEGGGHGQRCAYLQHAQAEADHQCKKLPSDGS